MDRRSKAKTRENRSKKRTRCSEIKENGKEKKRKREVVILKEDVWQRGIKARKGRRSTKRKFDKVK